MKKSTFGKTLASNRGFLPIAAGFMLMPSFFFAQTEKQIQAIKKETNLQALKVLQNNFEKNTLTAQQLQAEAKKKGLVYSGESKGQYFQLRGFDRKTGRPLYYVTTNAGASLGTQTNKLNSTGGLFNLDGQGMRVHEWDGGGVLTTHRELAGRVTQKDRPTSNSAHATHVAGTMVATGVDPRAKGMAPLASLDAYDWNSDETEMAAAAAAGALVSNHSYGYVGGFVWGNYSGNTGWHWVGGDDDEEYKLYGKYTSDDRDWDIIAYNAPSYLPVKAAGNPRGDGPEPGEKHYVQIYNADTQKWEWQESYKVRQKNGGTFGFDSVNRGALGKNVLVIGAAEKINGGYKQASDVKMASFSAFGPVDDGRIKPDISGIGVGLYSTNTGGTSSYTTMGGTSMASPNVSGSLILLQEHYKNLNADSFMKAATLRALVIATANEAGEHAGPDYKSGWGLLNAYKAAVAITTKDKYALISEKSLANGTTQTLDVVASGSEPLVVTIAWTDPAPKDLPDANELNQRLATLVNDLDVRVKKNGVEYFPWKLDPANPANAATKEDNKVDNVEQIVIDNPEAGATYTIEVTHKNTLRKNEFTTNAGVLQVDLVPADAQDYSLVVTGVNAGVNRDLAMKQVTVAVPAVEYSQSTPVDFEVENKGFQSVENGVLSYQLIDVATGQVVFSGQENLDVMAPGATQTKRVSLDLSQSFTEYKILATVQVEGDEVAINDKGEALAFGIVADIRADEAKHSFGFEDDFEKNGWKSQDIDADGRTWRKYDDATFANTGTSFAINFPNNKENTNDWIFSNPLKVSGGKLYRVVFSVRKFQDPVENLEVFYGTSPEVAAMQKTLGKVEVTDNQRYYKFHYEFTPESDQTIYIGFNNKTENGVTSYAVGVDDVIIQRAEGKPLVDFSASQLKPNTYETVSLTDETVVASTQPATAYLWSFEPATVEFQDGTTATSQNPKVVFKEEKSYKVSLKVTNAGGESEVSKTGYVVAKNTATRAVFTASATSIYEGEEVWLRNASAGNPMPHEFKWTITPSEGVEFLDAEGDAARSPKVRFTKEGSYSVKLDVKSAHNEHSATQSNLIVVSKVYNAVKGVNHTFDVASKTLDLTWERPTLNPIYKEGFETDFDSVQLTTYDGNGDGATWTQTTSGYRGLGALSYSWFFGAFDVDDWLVTPKLRAGAEELKYMIKHTYPERYDVYVVEAPDSGSVPTVEQLLAGKKVLEFDATGKQSTYAERKLNIKEHTGKDFFVAFHHRTRKADDGFRLELDEVEVGYNNAAATTGKVIEVKGDVASNVEDYKALVKGGERVVTSEDLVKPNDKPSQVVGTFGLVNIPYLTGYKVEKNDVEVKATSDLSDRAYKETIDANGSYVYKVYGVYSDGNHSEPVTVTVDITTLSTSDVKNEGLKIYPNPSDGRFVVDAGAGVTSLKVEVYDMSGKQIYKQDVRGNKADLNLTQYPKGVYILNLVDNNGKKQSAKLMIK